MVGERKKPIINQGKKTELHVHVVVEEINGCTTFVKTLVEFTFCYF